MSGGYYLSPEARANLDEICAFVADDSVEGAVTIKITQTGECATKLCTGR